MKFNLGDQVVVISGIDKNCHGHVSSIGFGKWDYGFMVDGCQSGANENELRLQVPRVVVETSEGKMEIDFNRMELYKFRGDLCCPMVQTDSEGYCWKATDPYTGIEYKIWKAAATEGKFLYQIRENNVTGRLLGEISL